MDRRRRSSQRRPETGTLSNRLGAHTGAKVQSIAECCLKRVLFVSEQFSQDMSEIGPRRSICALRLFLDALAEMMAESLGDALLHGTVFEHALGASIQ